MNAEKLKELREVNIDNVDRSKLVDIRNVKINTNLNPDDKAENYIEQIKNPYCFLYDGYIVKLEFSDNDKNISDCITDYIDTLL